MVTVRLKLVPKTRDQQLDQRLTVVMNEYESKPSPEMAAEGLAIVRELSIPRSGWPVIAVMGHFLKEYRRSYGVDYHSTSLNDMREGTVGLDEAIEYLGSNDVCKCIEVLFGPDMEWAKTKNLSMLTKKSNRDRFLVPLMAVAKKKSRGEFSEFAGNRSTEWSVKKL